MMRNHLLDPESPQQNSNQGSYRPYGTPEQEDPWFEEVANCKRMPFGCSHSEKNMKHSTCSSNGGQRISGSYRYFCLSPNSVYGLWLFLVISSEESSQKIGKKSAGNLSTPAILIITLRSCNLESYEVNYISCSVVRQRFGSVFGIELSILLSSRAIDILIFFDIGSDRLV